MRFAELAGQGLLALLDPAAAARVLLALLAPLAEYGSRADLMESLRAYLDSNGHWDAAAQRLGVHRHTLRYRMKRVAELLGRDLDDPGVRAELWLALSVRAVPGQPRQTPCDQIAGDGRAGDRLVGAAVTQVTGTLQADRALGGGPQRVGDLAGLGRDDVARPRCSRRSPGRGC